MSSPARIALFFVLSLTHGPSVSFAQSPTHEQQYNISTFPYRPAPLSKSAPRSRGRTRSIRKIM